MLLAMRIWTMLLVFKGKQNPMGRTGGLRLGDAEGDRKV